MDKIKLEAALEAIIFAAGTPVSVERLSEALEQKQDTVNEALDSLIENYNSDNHGISIIRLNNSVQMCTKKQFGDVIRTVMDLRRNTPLSQAAMEVLAVVAYNQPVTKAFIEQVRGVDCSGVVGSLCQKGLIEEKGRLELPGKPLIYGTTENFLRCFGIEAPENLPVLPKEKELNSTEHSEEKADTTTDNSDFTTDTGE